MLKISLELDFAVCSKVLFHGNLILQITRKYSETVKISYCGNFWQKVFDVMSGFSLTKNEREKLLSQNIPGEWFLIIFSKMMLKWYVEYFSHSERVIPDFSVVI